MIIIVCEVACLHRDKGTTNYAYKEVAHDTLSLPVQIQARYTTAKNTLLSHSWTETFRERKVGESAWARALPVHVECVGVDDLCMPLRMLASLLDVYFASL
jgi:hypothetical protein